MVFLMEVAIIEEMYVKLLAGHLKLQSSLIVALSGTNY